MNEYAKQELKTKRRGAEETRSIVLEAAVDLFADRGFFGTAVNDLASASGVNKANVLYFFSTKDEVWRLAVDLVFQRVRDFISYSDFIKARDKAACRT